MTPEKADEAAAILLRNWRAIDPHRRAAGSMPAARPGARATQIGAAVARQSGDSVAGWKIAATSAAGQKHINVDGPLGGRILEGGS